MLLDDMTDIAQGGAWYDLVDAQPHALETDLAQAPRRS
jgi:proline racemase